MLGFASVAVLLTMLICADPAAAQCGPRPSDANTECGTGALANNTGLYNSAFGFAALEHNSRGSSNTASGANALFSNTDGGGNTASGTAALYSNATGYQNTASGARALLSNTTGAFNTASGANALRANTMGIDNTASGFGALQGNIGGSSNIGIGINAGSNIVAGSHNIEIGATGVRDESNTIRLGTSGTQKKTYIAGISGTTVTGADVVVSSTGQLGVATSSARYKREIRDMGGASAGLMRLRPVSFRYKNDPSGTLQYGLVAEEVARVYPELTIRGTDGKVEGVRYLELTALLLNELQKQARQTRELGQRLEAKDRQLAGQQHQIDALKQQNASNNALSERLAALERQVRTSSTETLRSLVRK